MIDTAIIRWLGTQDYLTSWLSMQQFTRTRTEDTHDEIWLLEHPAVFTLGQNGKHEHILAAGDVPIVESDRGGQVTYHGPGQLMVYTLIDIKRKKLNIRELVTRLEQTVIQFLSEFKVEAYAKPKAPGVYVNEKKICSLGLRIRRGYAYHGLAFNVQMDLEPFTRINPCGFADLKMTQLSELTDFSNMQEASQKLIKYLLINLRYTKANYFNFQLNISDEYQSKR